MFGAMADSGWKAKAQRVAASLKSEYEAGKRGDETPAAPIWATPQQQLDGLLSIFRVTSSSEGDGSGEAADISAESETGATGSPAAPADSETVATADATAVVEAMRNVDWAGVRAATVERTNDATKAMKSMAEHVDWVKVQPVAAQVSSALIAAIATGQLGVGGRLASTVARAMTDQGGLGQRVAAQLEQTAPASVPTDFGPTIAAVSREA